MRRNWENCIERNFSKFWEPKSFNLIGHKGTFQNKVAKKNFHRILIFSRRKNFVRGCYYLIQIIQMLLRDFAGNALTKFFLTDLNVKKRPRHNNSLWKTFKNFCPKIWELVATCWEKCIFWNFHNSSQGWRFKD